MQIKNRMLCLLQLPCLLFLSKEIIVCKTAWLFKLESILQVLYDQLYCVNTQSRATTFLQCLMVWPCNRRDIFKQNFSFSLFAFYCDFIVITEKEKVISLTAQCYFVLDDLHGKLDSFVLVTKYLLCDSTSLCNIE